MHELNDAHDGDGVHYDGRDYGADLHGDGGATS
jgi:hypothetical protein